MKYFTLLTITLGMLTIIHVTHSAEPIPQRPAMQCPQIKSTAIVFCTLVGLCTGTLAGVVASAILHIQSPLEDPVRTIAVPILASAFTGAFSCGAPAGMVYFCSRLR